MSDASKKYLKFGSAITIIVLALAYLAFLGARESKSYYVTVKELQNPNNSLYSKHLRLVGNVKPGSIRMSGPNAEFLMIDNGQTQRVVYKGTEPPPDTFKDDAQALAIGTYQQDGVFHATELQAKCASKYATKQPQQQSAAEQPQSKTY